MTARLPRLRRCAAAALVLLGGRVDAQAARAVTTADFAWLAGSWQAHPANTPGTIEVTYLPPNAGLISGVMRLVDRDKVLVVELISMADTPDGLELRFRHFSATLEPYEAEFRQALRLTKHTPDRAVFQNQVPYDKNLMSTQPRVTTYIRHGPDEFLGHTDIIDSAGKPAVIEATYRRR